MTRSITLKESYVFFLPLIFMAELMMISHSVIHAFLARMENPQPILAAYSIAFYFHAALGSPVWTAVMVSIAYIKDKRSVVRLFWFYVRLASVLGWVWIAVGFTPLGSWGFQALFGATPAVAEQAQAATAVLFFLVPLVIVRSLAYALLMIHRRPILVTYGTVIRLLSLSGSLLVLPLVFEGAVVGAAALVVCIAAEAVYGLLMARPFYRALPDAEGILPTYGEIWLFAWPLMLVHIAESGVGLTINLFLGRLMRPELALAAFGVMDGIMRLLLSPLRSLTQTVQTLTHSREDLAVMLRFMTHMLIIFSVAMLLFFLPSVQTLVLEGLIGLPADIADYVAPALLLASLLAVAQGSSATFRGLLIGVRRTGAIAGSAGARILSVAAVGSIVFLLPDSNGAVVGIVALIAAFAAESGVLGWRLIKIDRGARRLFDPEPQSSTAE